MDLQFLGTSSGVPTKARNVSATAVIEATGNGWYLVGGLASILGGIIVATQYH